VTPDSAETPAERDRRLRREADAYVVGLLRDVWWLTRAAVRSVGRLVREGVLWW
jgi:hypothetical protein